VPTAAAANTTLTDLQTRGQVEREASASAANKTDVSFVAPLIEGSVQTLPPSARSQQSAPRVIGQAIKNTHDHDDHPPFVVGPAEVSFVIEDNSGTAGTSQTAGAATATASATSPSGSAKRCGFQQQRSQSDAPAAATPHSPTSHQQRSSFAESGKSKSMPTVNHEQQQLSPSSASGASGSAVGAISPLRLVVLGRGGEGGAGLAVSPERRKEEAKLLKRQWVLQRKEDVQRGREDATRHLLRESGVELGGSRIGGREDDAKLLQQAWTRIDVPTPRDRGRTEVAGAATSVQTLPVIITGPPLPDQHGGGANATSPGSNQQRMKSRSREKKRDRSSSRTGSKMSEPESSEYAVSFESHSASGSEEEKGGEPVDLREQVGPSNFPNHAVADGVAVAHAKLESHSQDLEVDEGAVSFFSHSSSDEGG